MSRSASDRVVDVLVEAGITHLFGLPGGNTMELWKALHGREHQVRAIVPRDEQTASCMADIYGKLTGKPGVFSAQGVFAGSTGLFGVIESYLSHSPMVVLSEMSEVDGFLLHGPIQGGTGSYGSIDLAGIFRGTTKSVAVAHYPREAVTATQLALKHAVAGCPGPTAVLYRSSAIKGQVPDGVYPEVHETAPYLAVEKTCPPPGALQKAADLLARAQRPVIVAGNGVRIARAFAELEQVAQRLGAAVVTSYLGKSVIAETHPLAVGPIGYTGLPLANETLGNADVVLVVGCRLKPQETCFASPRLLDPKRQTIIQLDVEPRNASWTVPAQLALAGDAQLSLQLLDEHLARVADAAAARERTRALEALKEARAVFSQPAARSAAVPLYPQRVVAELAEAVPEDAIVCTDAGNNRHWMNHFFRTKRANSYFGTGGIAGVSWSVAAALGAAILQPQRPAIAVCGDGGLAMQIHVLLTAVQYGVKPVWVVLNNSAFGMTGQGMGERSVGNDLPDTDYAKIARAFGCHAERVERPGQMREALAAALRQDKPAVLDVVIDANQNMKRELFSPWATEALAAAATKTY
ncbi:MAG TPA: thiamine pyrophosphate-binding protein [Ramlibacter sp.]|nr:thiamine pyrophosphate-binding protein [Ramlibacter sp.]